MPVHRGSHAVGDEAEALAVLETVAVPAVDDPLAP
jgi:hypothetical protein